MHEVDVTRLVLEDTARQARRMRVRKKIKMVVTPITRSVAQIRFREGGGNVEGSREWV